ncbi:hypothetical protein B0H11DRAFT_538140 [Mycena galericulata]|nr:hypothetical protein B0H11DRAFT_538140 [Mycena galericulata]
MSSMSLSYSLSATGCNLYSAFQSLRPEDSSSTLPTALHNVVHSSEKNKFGILVPQPTRVVRRRLTADRQYSSRPPSQSGVAEQPVARRPPLTALMPVSLFLPVPPANTASMECVCGAEALLSFWCTYTLPASRVLRLRTPRHAWMPSADHPQHRPRHVTHPPLSNKYPRPQPVPRTCIPAPRLCLALRCPHACTYLRRV